MMMRMVVGERERERDIIKPIWVPDKVGERLEGNIWEDVRGIRR